MTTESLPPAAIFVPSRNCPTSISRTTLNANIDPWIPRKTISSICVKRLNNIRKPMLSWQWTTIEKAKPLPFTFVVCSIYPSKPPNVFCSTKLPKKLSKPPYYLPIKPSSIYRWYEPNRRAKSSTC